MKFVRATILSDDPLIIFTGGSGDAPVSGSSLLAEPLRDRKVTFLILTLWSAESNDHADNLMNFVKKYEADYPNHEYIVFCNTQAEVENLARRGVRAYFGQQNSFIDPNVYKPIDGIPKDLQAVYTAQLHPFKRHALCADLDSVGLVYHSFGEETRAYYSELKQQIPGARFMNEELTSPPHGNLSAPEVVTIMNRAHVGLCLSAEEGGMHASVEYLLTGLPVVSTPSKGGRDFFFDNSFVEIVDPTPADVARGVREIIGRAPPAQEIRNRTIDLQRKQIALFQDYLDGLVKQNGGSGYDRSLWNARYRDKLLGWETLDEVLKRIPA
ncbi:hypothetical protein M446_3992 [Methylobacterium sp. 4-46]|uniref:glycosyltransferase n=1 Tax=unclassified Methylobacterium TaxID=2615210 RepID=UPI000152CACA|nr:MULTISPECIES: glycosyltransferase [Methylobacterium]ACA18357.1 hypothetical protein M446_3992 [Methylobacterium sp. 4-46]WFT77654.1 glycosyltransferase [Methylobacterium nodulans]